MGSSLVIVSNRLPITVEVAGERSSGGFELVPSVGGLATGLASFYRGFESAWIGWPGVVSEALDDTQRERLESELLSEHRCIAVHLTGEDVSQYYEGFANSTIWPLFHYFAQYCTYDEDQWLAYVRVNRAFADAVVEHSKPEDVIWVHDYHLMLVPEMVRQALPTATIGFFMHIPFPSFETYRLLPWRLEVLGGLLGCDLVGFHTYDYAKHFMSSVRSLVGHEHTAGEISAGTRVVKVDAFPMGIDFARYHDAPHDPVVASEATRIRERVEGRRVVLSVDRLDYSKGILRRIDAIETFLEGNPEFAGEVQVILVAVPSRTDVYEYDLLKRQVDEAVGRVNGRFGTIGWTPIEYLYTSLDFVELVALYDVAEVCLVTPLRDGMNLIAKEYLAAHSDGRGVLVLSEMAGAARELGEAVVVNPNNHVEVANAIFAALRMPEVQRRRRSESMTKRLASYDTAAWARDFVDSLGAARARQDELAAKWLGGEDVEFLLDQYSSSQRRVIFVDYDGTIVESNQDWSIASASDEELLDVMRGLVADPRNCVVVFSGRDRARLEERLGDTGANLVAEHGGFIRMGRGSWEPNAIDSGEWKEAFRALFAHFALRTPGATVEEGEFSLAWRYKLRDPELVTVRLLELKDAAYNLTANLEVTLTEDKLALEVRSARVNVGRTVTGFLEAGADFIVAIGDDRSDEEVFAAVPASAHTIKVGTGPSRAEWRVKGVGEVREILVGMAERSAT